MDVRGDVKSVVEVYLNRQVTDEKGDKNYRIIVLDSHVAKNLVRDKNEEILKRVSFGKQEIANPSSVMDYTFFEDIEDSSNKKDWDYHSFGDFRWFEFLNLQFYVYENDNFLDLEKLKTSKIFTEINSIEALTSLLETNLKKYGLNTANGLYERLFAEYENLDDKEKRVMPFEKNKKIRNMFFSEVEKNGCKIPDFLNFNSYDVNDFYQLYGRDKLLDLILKNPVNKLKVDSDIVNKIESYFDNSVLSDLEQQKLVKFLQKTKAVTSKDENGNITFLSKKLDDKYFNMLLKDFPTLKSLVSKVSFSEEIAENLNEQNDCMAFKWVKENVFNNVNIDTNTKDVLHKNRNFLIRVAASLSNIEVENSFNVGNGVEYFILDKTNNENFKLKDLTKELYFAIENYFENIEFRKIFMRGNVNEAVEMLEPLQNKKVMKQELEISGNVSKNNVKSMKF